MMTVSGVANSGFREKTPAELALIGGPSMERMRLAAMELLDRGQQELLQAVHSRSDAERYLHAHLSALRTAAAVVAVCGSRRRRRSPINVWEQMRAATPMFSDWADAFAAGAPTRAAIEAGRSEQVTRRESEDLVRDAERFHFLVRSFLSLNTMRYPGNESIDLSA